MSNQKGNLPTHTVRIAGEGEGSRSDEIGVAWEREDKNGNKFLSVRIPTLPRPVFIFKIDRDKFKQEVPDATPATDDNLPF